MTSNIYIDKSLNYDISRILALISLNINKTLDISPLILNDIFNNETFNKNITFIYEQLYIELIRNIVNYNKNYYSLNNSNSPNVECSNTLFLSGNNLCGYHLNKYNNGLIEFCNKDRYLHINENTNNQINDVIDHKFVYKSNIDINIEKRNNYIISLYQSYIDNLYINIYNILIYYIYLNTKVEYVNIYNIEKLNILFSKAEHTNNIFKEKHISIINNEQYIKVYEKL